MDFDVIVIGSGQAGVPLAARLAENGRRVLIAERLALGGTCVNYGCTPTKTMVASAAVAHAARRAHALGVSTGDVAVNMAAVVERKDRMVAEWRDAVRRRIDKAGPNLRLEREEARFVGPRRLRIGGETHGADVVIVNVGCRAAVPPIAGLDEVPWLDNVRAMDLRALPERLIVAGGGYIGCEFAQMYRRFGASVTVVDPAEHLLAREDVDVSEALESVFRDEGIELHLSTTVKSVERAGHGVAVHLSDGTTLEGSDLLVATGRRPNTDDLGCDAAGIRTDEAGYIEVDDEYRTSADGVFAVGDVAARGPQFTHSSWDDHRILFDILTGRGTRRRSDRIIPHAVFTDPQVAGVGITEAEAREAGLDVRVVSIPLDRVARARETGKTAGLLKLVYDAAADRVRGASVVAPEAAELIHAFALLIAADASPSALVTTEIVHPSWSEGLQMLVMELDRYALD